MFSSSNSVRWYLFTFLAEDPYDSFDINRGTFKITFSCTRKAHNITYSMAQYVSISHSIDLYTFVISKSNSFNFEHCISVWLSHKLF